MKGYSTAKIACGRCHVAFERYHSAQRYCGDCRTEAAKATQRKADMAFRERNKGDADYRAKRSARTREYVLRNTQRVREGQRRYAADNAVKKAEAAHRWREQNRERTLAAAQAYYEANKGKILARRASPEGKARRRTYEMERRAIDPKFAIDGRMAASIRGALRGRKSGRTWESLVGYSLEDLMAHLERQFVKGMGWHNVEDWHIDHILPKSSFHYVEASDPEFRRCWALPNLQPLWAKDNIRKHAKRLRLI